MKQTTALETPSPTKGAAQPVAKVDNSSNPRGDFLGMAVNMSWQLAVVVLVPIIGGVELGKAVGSSSVFTVIGLVVALVLSIVVMWRAMQAANSLPVPKLSSAQKRAVRKSYEEDDD